MRRNHDEEEKTRCTPWDQGVYQTGSTRPPKSHGGLIAFLLIAVIFLGGIASALGILNIKLFHKIRRADTTAEPMIAFSGTEPVSDSEVTLQTDPAQAETLPTLGSTPAAVPNIPQEGGLSLQEIYRQVIPSVVSISCSTRTGSTSGTGVVLSENGYLVTNCHVIRDAAQINVLFTDGQTFPAALVGQDETTDLAVLKVEAEGLTPAQFGNSEALQVGDLAVAIGDPLGTQLRGTMTNGIISAINREVTVGGRTMTLIQTNAALNEGNSGGPLLNCYGQVIGINTLKIGDSVSTAGVEGLGFAIPSATVQEIVSQLVQQGYVSGRPTLGIEGISVSVFYQMYYLLPAGMYIESVEEGSNAEDVGLQEGDILMQVDGVRISGPDDLNTLLYGYQVGDKLSIVFYRGGYQYSATLTVEEANG